MDYSLEARFRGMKQSSLEKVARFLYDIAIPRIRFYAIQYERDQFRRTHAEEYAAFKADQAEMQARVRDVSTLRIDPMHGRLTYKDFQVMRSIAHTGRPFDTSRQRELYDLIMKMEPHFAAEKRNRERIEKAEAKKAEAGDAAKECPPPN